MVSKSKKENAGKKKKIKVLNLNKETVKDLTDEESKRVKGGTTQCLVGLKLTTSVVSGIRETSASSVIIGQSGSAQYSA